MRIRLASSIGITFLCALAGQSQVPREQCLGGTLVAIQPNSISLKFNQKTTTLRLARAVEIWRRGVDLNSISQLVVGDNIYTECILEGGAVVASIVAAVEKDDAVRMVPHHLVEIRVCGGHLVAIAKDALSVKNDAGICVVHLKPDTGIWRGEIFHDTGVLKLGDEILARVTVDYPGGELIADGEVFANITNTEGTVVAVRSDRIVVDQYSGADKHSGYAHGRVTVLFDARTSIDSDQGNLKKGVTVRAIGLDLGHDTFRATTIVVEP